MVKDVAKPMIDENDMTAAYMAGLADRDDALRKACVAAAAKALREASEAYEAFVNDAERRVFGESWDRILPGACRWLRARADGIEGGEA